MGLTSIEWANYSFNAWLGCRKLGRECKHCYITRTAPFRTTKLKHGSERRHTSASSWRQPLAWDRKANMLHRPRVFCNSLADWLDDEVPIAWFADLMMLVEKTQNLDWLFLSKRPGNFFSRVEAAIKELRPRDEDTELARIMMQLWLDGAPPFHVWVGTSVGVRSALPRVEELCRIPARLRFLSCEPLLEEVDLSIPWSTRSNKPLLEDGSIHWVIGGGESGDEPTVAPTHPDWARGLRDQCAAADVPFFWKQWGEWRPCSIEEYNAAADTSRVFYGPPYLDGWRTGPIPRTVDEIRDGLPPGRVPVTMLRVGKKNSGRLLDGVLHDELPIVAPLRMPD